MRDRHVPPAPIKCEAMLAGGRRCEEVAVVTNVQYTYDRQPTESDQDNYVLREIHYRIACPNCGERKIVENASAD